MVAHFGPVLNESLPGLDASPGPDAPSDSTPALRFGVNADAVAAFLDELHTFDGRYAFAIWTGRGIAIEQGYARARETAATAAAAARHAEWLAAREAAAAILGDKIGPSLLDRQVLEILAASAGAIVVRDLISPEDFDLLLLPWTRHTGGRGNGHVSWSPPAAEPGPDAATAAGAENGSHATRGSTFGWLRRLVAKDVRARPAGVVDEVAIAERKRAENARLAAEAHRADVARLVAGARRAEAAQEARAAERARADTRIAEDAIVAAEAAAARETEEARFAAEAEAALLEEQARLADEDRRARRLGSKASALPPRSRRSVSLRRRGLPRTLVGPRRRGVLRRRGWPMTRGSKPSEWRQPKRLVGPRKRGLRKRLAWRKRPGLPNRRDSQRKLGLRRRFGWLMRRDSPRSYGSRKRPGSRRKLALPKRLGLPRRRG